MTACIDPAGDSPSTRIQTKSPPPGPNPAPPDEQPETSPSSNPGTRIGAHTQAPFGPNRPRPDRPCTITLRLAPLSSDPNIEATALLHADMLNWFIFTQGYQPVRSPRARPTHRHDDHTSLGTGSRLRSLTALAAALICLIVPILGCASAINENAGDTSGNTSIFQLIPLPPSPVVSVQWANDPIDPDKRFRGTLALANSSFGGERVYVELYERHLTDQYAPVRIAALRGLTLHGSGRHVQQVTPLLQDPDRSVRREAAIALQRLHHPDAVGPLIARTRPDTEPEKDVRAEAAEALGQYAERRVVESLIAALADPRLSVGDRAAASLTTLTGQNIGPNRAEWAEWANEHADDLFAERQNFTFRVFNRDRRWFEHIPFWPPPPNETAATPAGMAGLPQGEG